MTSEATRIVGRANILAVLGDSPYTRMAVTERSVAYLAAHAVACFAWTPWASLVSMSGNTEASAELFGWLRRSGRVSEGTWLRVPLSSARRFRDLSGIRLREEWQFRWLSFEPPMQKGEDTVAPIPPEQLPAVEELLRSGNPRTVVRSDAPGIHQWYGIWHGDELVACGADRSFGQVGYLAAITVSPGARRKGLGASLTSAMARKLLSDTGSVALGVNVANDGAIQLYEKLGFKDVVEVATFEVTA